MTTTTMRFRNVIFFFLKLEIQTNQQLRKTSNFTLIK